MLETFDNRIYYVYILVMILQVKLQREWERPRTMTFRDYSNLS